MTEFKSIVLPIDFSAYCDGAAAYASWFAVRTDAVTHLVHVVANPADALYDPQEVPYWVMRQHAEARARELLAAAAQRCLPAECAHDLHVLHGDPYEKIMETAKAVQADLIVMSTHGRGGVAHLVIGSVAEKVVRHAPCPVFVVRRTGA